MFRKLERQGRTSALTNSTGVVQYDQAAAAATTGEHTAAAHLAEQAEAAADKLEGRAGGTYQAQIEHAAVRASC